MGILRRISSLFGSSDSGRNYWFYVKCDNCGEVLKGRVDMQNDLSLIYGSEKEAPGYYCRKVIVGSKRCFRPIEVEFFFDSNRKKLDRKIQGGEFVIEEEYLQNYESPN